VATQPGRFIGVAFHTLPRVWRYLCRCRWLVKGSWVQVLTEWEGLPILAVLPFPILQLDLDSVSPMPRAAAWGWLPDQASALEGFLWDAGEIRCAVPASNTPQTPVRIQPELVAISTPL